LKPSKGENAMLRLSTILSPFGAVLVQAELEDDPIAKY